MALRAQNLLQVALVATFTVASASTSTVGLPQTLTAEGIVRDSTTGEDPIGVCIATMKSTPGAAGEQVSVALHGNAIVRVQVGTANSTVAKWQVVGTTGVTDAATPGGGTTVQYICGRAMATGVSGDFIPMLISSNAGVHA